MRILLVNKFHYLKGGSEKYYFELGKLLKDYGNEIAYFTMKNDKNIETGDKQYYVNEIDLNNGSKLKALDIIYSKENYKKFEKVIKDFKPDIVHLNNFQRQLSESIIECCYKYKIPMVFTAHDVQAICPAISMLDSDKRICEDCVNGKYTNCIKKKCIKKSNMKSILGAIEAKYYRIKKVYTKKINYIITPSEFYRNKFIKDGISQGKIKSIHNFIDTNGYNLKVEDQDYVFYSGRLSIEKGILNLIEAFSKLIKENKNLKDKKLLIAGDGPEKEKIEKIIKINKLEKNIILLGYLNQDELKDYIRKCKFAVVPSIWYENGPYSVIEIQLIGKAIIGADIGGIPEMVINNENGLTYKYDDINELMKKMKLLFDNKDLVRKYGIKAKEFAKNEYDKKEYYDKLIEIYNKVKIDNSKE